MILASHVSPDGTFTWIVEVYSEPDGTDGIAMGFDGFGWHLHPDSVDRRERTDQQIAADATEALLADRLLIMTTTDGEAVEHSLLDDLEVEVSIKSYSERWTFRFWSGRSVEVDDLIDGKVGYLPLRQA